MQAGVTKAQLEKSLCEALAGSFSATVVEFNSAVASKVGLHDTDFKLISTLAAFGGEMNPKALGAQHHMSTAATTLAVDRLEAARLVKRLPDESDGRKVIIKLVAESAFERDLGESMASLATWMMEVTRGFTVDELKAALRFLKESGAVLGRVTQQLRHSAGDTGR